MILRILWLVLALMLVPVPAWADANDLAREALVHYNQGQWKDAIRLFEEAEELTHSPVFVLHTARCHRNLGQLVQAHRLLKMVVDESVPADASEPFHKAQRDAKDDLEALSLRIPKLAIDRTAIPATWTVELDGSVVVEATVRVDPGDHLVVAKEGAVERFREQVTAVERATKTIKIVPPAPEPRPEPEPIVVQEQDTLADLAPGLALIGVGTVSLGIGVLTRVIALQKADDITSRCIQNSCLKEDEESLNSAFTLETVSSILLIAGGAVLATGVVLVLVLPESETPSVALELGPGSLSLRATF